MIKPLRRVGRPRSNGALSVLGAMKYVVMIAALVGGRHGDLEGGSAPPGGRGCVEGLGRGRESHVSRPRGLCGAPDAHTPRSRRSSEGCSELR
jgi:hypothetical protein